MCDPAKPTLTEAQVAAALRDPLAEPPPVDLPPAASFTRDPSGIPHGGVPEFYRWAETLGHEPWSETLRVTKGPRPVKMAHSPATGASAGSNGLVGADIIRLNGGDGFVPHTHPGHHVLAVLAGDGLITYGGVVYPTHAGEVYVVEGLVAHGVGAIEDHVILAFGAPHMPVDSPDRMTPVEYRAVLADDAESMTCLVTGVTVKYPRRLHDVRIKVNGEVFPVPTCPCADCLPREGNSPERRAERQRRITNVLIARFGTARVATMLDRHGRH